MNKKINGIPIIKRAKKPSIKIGISNERPNCIISCGTMAEKTLPIIVLTKMMSNTTLDINSKNTPMRSVRSLTTPLASFRSKSEKSFDFFYLISQVFIVNIFDFISDLINFFLDLFFDGRNIDRFSLHH